LFILSCPFLYYYAMVYRVETECSTKEITSKTPSHMPM
jgi:hypothetical protein